jgi:adenosylmethionine-8-amino-7-oxononanoate aminotransferase
MNNEQLIKLDLNHIWHPCTQMKDHEFLPLIPIKSAKGIYLYDFDGNSYIDAISSWWVNLFGHCNSYINNKVKKQLDTLEHVILAGFSHEPAIKLAKKLVEITPKSLEKVFFADNGSSAIEVALKMSYHYFANKGIYKDTFLSLTNSYHGETLGALSVGDVELYKKTYKPLLINNMQTPVPKNKTKNAAKEALIELEAILQKHHKRISAFIIEPLIQGAGSMHMYHPLYIKGARELTNKYNIHLIADEIMTGFGRTGSMFAIEQAKITPDFLALSKGLTGGYLPLSVVLTTNEIYSAFYCDYNEHKAFLHSHSYTGNPLACSAALATIEIFENENILEKNKILINHMAKRLKEFEEFEKVTNIRQTGMVGAFTIKGYKPQDRIGLQVYTYALQKGVLLRPLGNTIYFMPPYIITTKELDKIFNVAKEALLQLK